MKLLKAKPKHTRWHLSETRQTWTINQWKASEPFVSLCTRLFFFKEKESIYIYRAAHNRIDDLFRSGPVTLISPWIAWKCGEMNNTRIWNGWRINKELYSVGFEGNRAGGVSVINIFTWWRKRTRRGFVRGRRNSLECVVGEMGEGKMQIQGQSELTKTDRTRSLWKVPVFRRPSSGSLRHHSDGRHGCLIDLDADLMLIQQLVGLGGGWCAFVLNAIGSCGDRDGCYRMVVIARHGRPPRSRMARRHCNISNQMWGSRLLPAPSNSSSFLTIAHFSPPPPYPFQIDIIAEENKEGVDSLCLHRTRCIRYIYKVKSYLIYT